MCSSIQLKEFLQEISEEAKFVKFEYESSEKFDVLIKCKVKEDESAEFYKEHVKNWINQFSNFTQTIWMVRNCYPRAKRFLFRKTYACHYAAHRVYTAKQQMRNKHCKATIHFKITNANDRTAKKDPHYQEGLNMTIAIDFEHTHSLKTKKDLTTDGSLSTEKLSRSVFYELFDEGYTAVAAKCYHVLRLIEMYGHDSEELEDVNVNPRIQQIQYLYNRRWNQKEINVNEVMTKKVETLENIGHTIRYSVKPSFAVILTPVMKRVLSHLGLQRVLIDSTLEHGAPFTLFLYVPSMIGSLPIACVTFTEMNKGIFLQIFLTVKIAIQTLTGVNFEPEVLLHDDDPIIKEALTAIFPNSIIILNRYSLCRDFWRWICDDRLVIKPEPLTTIVLFKSLVFARCLAQASIVHHNMITSFMPEKCFEKVDFVWLNRKQWINDNELCVGFSDAPIYFLKEFILQLCKPFNGNLPAMVDVITNVIGNHYNKILLAHRDGDVMRVYAKFLAKTRVDSNSDIVRKVGPNEYHIQDAFNRSRFNKVNTDTMCCDCNYGKRGRMCEHLCALLILYNDTCILFSSLGYNGKNTFLKILGDTDTTIKSENKYDDLEIEETAIDSEICLSSKGNEEDYNPEIKKEVNDFLDTNQTDLFNDEEMSFKSWLKGNEENYEVGIKSEKQDFLETNYGGENSDHVKLASEDSSIEDASKQDAFKEDSPKEDLKEQYEVCMKCVNDEFLRLSTLFKDNPNVTNLYTMQRLAEELAKVLVVEEVKSEQD